MEGEKRRNWKEEDTGYGKISYIRIKPSIVNIQVSSREYGQGGQANRRTGMIAHLSRACHLVSIPHVLIIYTLFVYCTCTKVLYKGF